MIDVSLTESMFRLLDFFAIEYDQLGVVRGRRGNRNPYAAPGNVYQAKDGRWITVPASTQALFERLMKAVDRPDLAADPRYRANVDRVADPDELETAIRNWVGRHDADEACRILDANAVANASVRTIDELFADPHFEAAEMIVSVEDAALGAMRMQGVSPRLSKTPGRVYRNGPAHGEETDAIVAEELGLSADEIAELHHAGVI